MASVSDLLAPSIADRPVLLFRGDEAAAQLDLRGTDFPWVEYRFTPLQPWMDLGDATAVFSFSSRRGREGIDLRVRAIEDLDLSLASEDGSVRVRDFLLHVRGDRALVRSFPRGVLPSELRFGQATD